MRGREVRDAGTETVTKCSRNLACRPAGLCWRVVVGCGGCGRKNLGGGMCNEPNFITAHVPHNSHVKSPASDCSNEGPKIKIGNRTETRRQWLLFRDPCLPDRVRCGPPSANTWEHLFVTELWAFNSSRFDESQVPVAILKLFLYPEFAFIPPGCEMVQYRFLHQSRDCNNPSAPAWPSC